LPIVIDAVEQADQEGRFFHDLNPTTKGQLALLGFVTTSTRNVQDPGSYGDVARRRRQERALAVLPDTSTVAMSNVPEYKSAIEENALGLTMAATLTKIRGLRHHGVGVEGVQKDKLGTILDGTVVSKSTSFSVPDETASTKLHTLFQGMLSTWPERHIVDPHPASTNWSPPRSPSDPNWIPPAKIEKTGWEDESTLNAAELSPRPSVVEVTNYNEYVARILDEAMRLLIARELKLIGVALPEQKRPLVKWLETETFQPEIQAWLEAQDSIYPLIPVATDYLDEFAGKGFAPITEQHPDGTQPAAIGQRIRDGWNSLVRSLPSRHGGHNNKEQHPDPEKRLAIELGLHVKRPYAKPGKPYLGVPTTIPLNILERGVVRIKEAYQDAKTDSDHLIEIIAEVAGKVPTGIAEGVILGAVLLAKGAVALGRGTKNGWSDFGTWRREKHQARSRLGELLEELRLKQTYIANGVLEDALPESTLKPSRQLDLVKQMTDLMLSQLEAAPAAGLNHGRSV